MRIHAAHVTSYERDWPAGVLPRSGKRLGAIVTLFDQEGRSAQGEAAPLPPFTSESHGECLSELERLVEEPSLAHTAFSNASDIEAWVTASTRMLTVRHALEQALLSLLALTNGSTIAQIIGRSMSPLPGNHALVASAREAFNAVAGGHSALKVKVAGLSAQEVIERLDAIRSAVGTEATLRIDANQSWSYDEALEILAHIQGSCLEFVEEPLMDPTPAALRMLRHTTGVSVACDESVRTPDDLERLLSTEACDVVVLKPMFIGGLLPSLALATRAHEAGLKVVVTSSLDGDLARDHAQICARLTPPAALLPCGLGTSSSSLLLPPTHGPEKQVPHPLQAAQPAQGGQEALCAHDTAHTFAELAECVAQRAGQLRIAGVMPGQRINLPIQRDPASLVDFWAITWLGAVPVLLDPQTPMSSYTQALSKLGSIDIPDVPESEPVPVRATPWQMSDERLILFTSGSTGQSQPVVLTTEQLLLSALGQAARIGHHLNDRWGCALPLHHIGGISIILRTAWLGTTSVLYDAWDASEVSKDLDNGRITLLSVVPAMLEELLSVRQDKAFPESTRAILVGGAQAPAHLLERCRAAGAPVAFTWGMTEAASQVATNPPGNVEKALAPLVTATVNQAGSALRISSPLVNGSIITQDAGRLLPTGRVEIDGRLDDIIISGGENISLREIHAAIASHPSVRDVHVLPVKDPKWGERPWALVVPASGPAGLDEGELRDFLAMRLGPYKTPDRFAIIDALPRNAMGKILRQQARAVFENTSTPPTPDEISGQAGSHHQGG